ncbi:MAG: hypothetical protein IJ055_09115 [Oscillospiraceae bacterium]|nr:hypothetical protein [Oscillospiraceae bacterium]
MKRRYISAAIAAVLCAVSVMPVMTAQAEYLIDPELNTQEDVHVRGWIVYEAKDPSMDQLKLSDVYLTYSADSNTYYMHSVPSVVRIGNGLEGHFFPTYYAPDQKEVEVGDVLIFEGPVSIEESLPPTLTAYKNDLEEGTPVIRNIGRYDELFHTEELTVTELKLMEGGVLIQNAAFTNSEGKSFSLGSGQSEYQWRMDGLEVGGTVKAVTYGNAAVPIEIVTAAPLPEGDPDGDGAVNAKDASAVLMTAAQIGAKRKPGLTLAQRNACDVNKDGAVNAKDASYILRYAAYIGAKNPYKSISEFLQP